MRTMKRSLFTSLISLLLCFAMLIGATYAWFTDTVTSGSNIIQSGNLDIAMYWSENNADWNNAQDTQAGPIFDYDKWEPGYTLVRYIKVKNEGSLAFKYQMLLSPNGTVDALANVIDVSYDVVTDNADFVAPTAQDKNGSLTKVGTLSDLIAESGAFVGGVLLPANKTQAEHYSGEIVICVSFHMQEDAGNEYQNNSIGTSFDITLYATQYDHESDSFGSDYDKDATWGDIPTVNVTATAPITLNDDGTLANETTMRNEEGNINVTLPAGIKFNQGISAATLSVSKIENSAANITLTGNEQTKSYDVHVEGIAADNTVPVAITIDELLPVGLNAGNFKLYHVENDVTIEMVVRANGEAPAHNTFDYDPATGNVTLYLASFSEVALVAGEATWEGEYDYSWYTPNAKEYYISNADQLAAFGALVGYMTQVQNGKYVHTPVGFYKDDEHYGDDFKDKTVHLLANIDLGDYEDANTKLIFYPIGYFYTNDKDGDGNTNDPYSTVCSFEGTFDGNGYKIANFYQNTWDIDGDYEGVYYKDAMGLFGYLVNATIKNLTVDRFSSDGEFTPTGTIAAYACNSSFENIAITNCNPRVYNTGNGGIVGIGGNSDDPDSYQLTFTNITVDNTNKITSLWGSWDTACGGLIGMFRGDGHVKMTNCHVGAQIDVYNDVCGNYQYYWYRYSGMLIGTNKNMYTDDNGYTVPETDKFEATGCTVHFGDWNGYYYCELVANSLASYTHDHQFSRLTEIASLDEIKTGDTWTKTGNFLLIDGDTKTCYHIVKDANGNLKQHLHTDAGYEDSIDEDNDGNVDLKEDKQIVYLPFNQLFTGYGWGVKHIPIYNDASKNPFKGVTILDREQANSVEKFEGRRFNGIADADGVIKEGTLISPISGRTYKLSHIFNYLESSGVPVLNGAITVSVTNLNENGTVTAELDRNFSNWADSEIVFSGGGRIRLTIQDYYYCTPTSIEIVVRNYPEGSRIRNFTYDGFQNGEGYTFQTTADHITNGKHGKYEYDFGFGPEILEYSHKINTAAVITFVPENNGSIIIAYASENVGATLKVNGEVVSRIDEAFKLNVVYIEAAKGRTYHITRGEKESGLYYVAFLPNTVTNAEHTHAYFTENQATCEKGGVTNYICLVCGNSYTEYKNALGHEWVNEPGYKETCTDHGKAPGVYCARCDKIESGCETIQPHGHQYVNGFCQCSSDACHEPEKVTNIKYEVDFTTGTSTDYTDYGTNSFFKPNGNIDMSNNKNFLILKTISDTEHSYIEFTVDQAVTFYAKVSSTDRGKTSKFVLMSVNAEGQEAEVASKFHQGKAEVVVEGVSGHTLVYTLQAGTYRFYCTSTDRVGRLMTMKISTTLVN